MGHPLAPNLTELTNEELNKKYNDLVTRMNQAYRWGNPGMVGQLQMLMQDYQEELANRSRKALEEMEKNSKNFKNIIDIK
jgi:hypothetical protein